MASTSKDQVDRIFLDVKSKYVLDTRDQKDTRHGSRKTDVWFRNDDTRRKASLALRQYVDAAYRGLIDSTQEA